MTPHHIRLVKVSIVAVSAAAIAAFLAGCATSSHSAVAPEPVLSPSTSSDAAPANDPTAVQPDAAWECGYVSAVRTVTFHAGGLLAKGLIDQSSHDARREAAQQMWSVFPQGTSSITPLVREAVSLAREGVMPDDPSFEAVVDKIISACTANGTPIILGALASQGG